MDNQLVVIANQAGLAEEKSKILLQSFGEHFSKAKNIVQGAKDIVVTEESQVELMKKARVARLALKDIRVEVEKTRKEMKEQSLREGKAIDGISNVIKALIVPVEEHLEKQEKFAEIREQARIEKRHSDRISRLSQYVADVSLYNLKDMEDETFEKLLDQSEKTFEAQKEAEKAAEVERQAKIEAERKEQERIRIENEKLKKEAQMREAELAKEREALQRKLDAERKSREEALAKERAEAARKIEAERMAREALEKKLADEKRAQEEREQKVAAEEAAKKKAEEDARHAAMVAPDKEKLLRLADTIQMIQFPAVESAKAKGSLERLEQRLGTVIAQLREEAKAL